MSALRLTNRLATRAPRAGLSRALAIEDAMGKLIFTAILLAIVTPAAAQTADRLYLMDCGHNSAKDQARWSPGVNVGKPIELSDTCVLIKHREQWLLWDTSYPDAVADQPVDTPVGHATRAKKLISQLGELNLKPSDIAFVAISHTHGDHVGNVDLFPDSTLLGLLRVIYGCTGPSATRQVNLNKRTPAPGTRAGLPSDP